MNSKLVSLIRNGYKKFSSWRELANSREQAHILRNQFINKKENTIVDQKMLKQIKEYASALFGSEGYWPWLALYTEIRGEFIEGWIPDDYYRFVLMPKLNPSTVSMLSTIKTFDHRLFSGFSIDPLAVRISGKFYDHQHEPIGKLEFYELLKSYHKEVVIKRDAGPSGREHLFKYAPEVRPDDFKPGCDYLVQPAVRQHKVLESLSNSSVNTVRVATFIEKDDSIGFKYAILRFGINGARVDNVGAGGRLLLLDDDGTVTSNAYDHSGLGTGESVPGTDFPYKGLTVPSFSKAVEKCLEAHARYPYVKFIAWDVFIDEEGTPKLIEWNARCPDIIPEEALIGPIWPELPV